jgi:hypothetical protein
MVRRALTFLAFGVFFTLFGVAVLDYVLFIYHQRHGQAYSYVTVRQFLESPLKGSRVEYDYVGPVERSCVRALLPHQQSAPCWWMRAHKDHWTKP